MKRFFKKIDYLLLCALLSQTSFVLSSCQGDRLSSSETKAISNRSQNVDPISIVLVKLKSPALLEDSSLESGHLSITEERKTQLLNEHKIALEKLKLISPEIELIQEYHFVLNA